MPLKTESLEESGINLMSMLAGSAGHRNISVAPIPRSQES
jgi:hypothetical protein